jgi:hypothetical protein
MGSMIEVAAASRPKSGEEVNGDEWAAVDTDSGCRIAVIDGLGHGPLAAEPATRARSTFLQHPGLPLPDVLKACHLELRGGRGAVASLVEISGRSLSFVGVGNVEGRTWNGVRPQRLIPARGILGSALPTLRIEQIILEPTWALVIYTDGISDRFDLQAIFASFSRAQDAANAILADFGRNTDDATVVVAVGLAVENASNPDLL